MTTSFGRALVTGASSGIGEELARQLAAAGTHLVVVARDEVRLKSLAAELGTAELVVEVLPADLADPADRARVEERLGRVDAPVDLLVNNAGFGTNGLFTDLPIDGEEREIAVNVTTLVRLTHAALAGMRTRGKGAILNVSSMASLQPSPRNATYGATKAFVTSFSEAIHEELRGTGVTVTALLPGFTRTEFQVRAGMARDAGMPGFMWMSAETVARDALAAVARGDALCVPGMGNKVLAAVTAPLPRGVKRRVVGLLSRRF